MKLKKVIEELNLFERERTPMETRILGIATYIQTSLLVLSYFPHSNLEVDKEA